MTTPLVRGNLYRLFVERPTQGVGSKKSFGWEKYVPKTTAYSSTFTERELFAGLGNNARLSDLKRGTIVLFLEETSQWISVVHGDQVCWIQKRNHVGYRIALCHPEQEMYDTWTMSRNGSVITWKSPGSGITNFLRSVK